MLNIAINCTVLFFFFLMWLDGKILLNLRDLLIVVRISL